MSLPPSTRCLVVGASNPSSIGYACVSTLLKAGATSVTLVGRDATKVQVAVDSLKESASGVVYGVVGDLKKPETMKEIVDQAVEKMGGLDILIIGGANGYSEYLGLPHDEIESYRLMNDVGVISPLFLTEAAFPELAKSGQGSVVMISSVAPLVPWPDTAPFNIAKAAQNTMLQNLAFKYRASNVRVNGIMAGCIHSGALDVMAAKKQRDIKEYAGLRASEIPLQRNGTPQEVAEAALYLAATATFTTGELLKVDGGLHLSSWFNKPKMLAEFEGNKNR